MRPRRLFRSPEMSDTVPRISTPPDRSWMSSAACSDAGSSTGSTYAGRCRGALADTA
jgi:hypothetical protein